MKFAFKDDRLLRDVDGLMNAAYQEIADLSNLPPYVWKCLAQVHGAGISPREMCSKVLDRSHRALGFISRRVFVVLTKHPFQPGGRRCGR